MTRTDDILLSPNQAWGLTNNFLQVMLEKCPDRFLNHGEGYMMFDNFISCSLTGIDAYVWQRCYSATSLKPFPHDLEISSSDKSISPEEVFKTVVAVVCEYCYLYGFHIFEFIDLLHNMKCNPEKYPKENKIWREAVQSVLQ